MPPRTSPAPRRFRPAAERSGGRAKSRHGNDAFDAAYYARFYEEGASRVYGATEVAHLCRAIVELCAWYGAPVTSVLDVGAGTGLWRDWFRDHMPNVRYRSIEVSAHACERYGHEQRDISRWRAKERFDLVVCQGVLPYLDDAALARAVDNIAAMSRRFFYLEAITKRDIAEVVDTEKTDVAGVHARPGRAYRALLRPHFQHVGCGLHHRRGGDVVFYELEAEG